MRLVTMQLVRSAALFLLLASVCAATFAGSLRVAPTRLELPSDRHAAVLTVTNTGSQPVLLQLEPKRWLQIAGSEDYVPADDLIVSPPIFTLDPGAEQLVRVGRRETQLPQGEQAYRLFVQEVPSPLRPATQQLNVVLRIGIPVFATPPEAPIARLEWSLRCAESGPPTLRVVNTGGRAHRIDELTVRAEGTDTVVRALYVLAGAIRAVPLTTAPLSARRVDFQMRSGDRETRGFASCD